MRHARMLCDELQTITVIAHVQLAYASRCRYQR